MLPVPQEYIGQVNVVGDCYCFGVALHLKLPAVKLVPVYVNVTGAASSVEALWAKLTQGKPALVTREGNAPGIFLEPDDKGLYVRFQKKIEGLGIDHLLLVHRDLAEPQYPVDGSPTNVYAFWLSEAQGIAKLGEHVRKAVKVAVFDPWGAYLNTAGRQAGLVKPLSCYGPVSVLAITLDPVRWTEVIADGLKSAQIRLPA